MAKSKDLTIEEPGASAPAEETPPTAVVDPQAAPPDAPATAPQAPPLVTPVPMPVSNPTGSAQVDPTKLRPTERVLTDRGWVVPADANQIVDRNHPNYRG